MRRVVTYELGNLEFPKGDSNENILQGCWNWLFSRLLHTFVILILFYIITMSEYFYSSLLLWGGILSIPAIPLGIVGALIGWYWRKRRDAQHGLAGLLEESQLFCFSDYYICTQEILFVFSLEDASRRDDQRWRVCESA